MTAFPCRRRSGAFFCRNGVWSIRPSPRIPPPRRRIGSGEPKAPNNHLRPHGRGHHRYTFAPNEMIQL
jgi:hypothetical protein